jgi:cyanate permease
MVTTYTSIKVVSGIITAAPLLTFGVNQLIQANTPLGIASCSIGLIGYFLPGWILDRYIEKMKKTVPIIN